MPWTNGEENRGKKYSLSIRIWKQNRVDSSRFFKYPDEIRKIIYTTNAVEAVHRQFRKLTKQRSIFPNDDVLKKMLFLVYRVISKK
ncbi:transposase [Ignavibacterium album]|uniref:transposase n=1 Tax=Ignavibacterium album TaxID=591197 RepID=UPI0035B8D544